MVNNEILGGLKSALERGQSLKLAMMSFYNAGYDKKEIEEAARALKEREAREEAEGQFIREPIPPQKLISQPKSPIKKFFSKLPTFKKPSPQLPVSVQSSQQPIQPRQLTAQVIPQRVSSYGESKKSDKLIIIILIVSLFFLIGILATIFFFRQELMALFSRLF